MRSCSPALPGPKRRECLRQIAKALQPRAGMLRPAPFEAVGQEQHYSAQTPPFVFRAGDELIDDHLRGIPEIAELRLPCDQALRTVEAVTVLKAEHARF